MTENEKRERIAKALKAFTDGEIFDASVSLFDILGYDTSLREPLDEGTYKEFKTLFVNSSASVQLGKVSFNEQRARAAEWKRVELLFQLTDESLRSQWIRDGGGDGDSDSDGDGGGGGGGRKIDTQVIKSYLFFAIDLTGREYSRSALSAITREVNKVFPMPVMIVFRYGEGDGRRITIAANNRRVDRRDEERDVLLKVSLIKDIKTGGAHRAHIDILFDLCFDTLQNTYRFTDFVGLHNAWIAALDTKLLNKKFYAELFAWYDERAIKAVKFPAGKGWEASIKNDKGSASDINRNRENLIRLITRVMFVWFIKQKWPDRLDWIFDEEAVRRVLRKGVDLHSMTDGTYYNAILQNLFFATLNRQIVDEDGEGRLWATAGGDGENDDYSVKNKWRDDKEKSFFHITHDDFAALMNKIPFLNGGLFECLDTADGDNPHLVVYRDGFSREAARRAFVPNALFFGGAGRFDTPPLRAALNDPCDGLFDIFRRYYFTVEESTPLEVQVALDPELLGAVFENLLASFNPETQESARKDSGSFYTPREIVGYMVDEVIKEVLSDECRVDSKCRVLSDECRVKEEIDGGEGIQRADCVAKGNASGRGGVRASKETAARRDVCNKRSDEAGGGVNAVKHSGGARAQFNEGVYSVPVDSKGVEVRAGDSTGAVCTGGDALSRRYNSNLRRTSQRGKDDKCSYKETCIENNIRRPSLSPSLSPLAALFSDEAEVPDLTLETRRALVRRISSVKILDPACGSGAFPMGVLLRLSSLLAKLDPKGSEYEHKRYIIENCIYGVDIQSIAMQITKLRFFISLVIEQQITGDAASNYGIRALPNLETKFVCANTLIGIKREEGMFIDRDIEAAQNALLDVRRRYVTASSYKAKKRLQKEDKKYVKRLLSLLEKNSICSTDEARLLSQWSPYNHAGSSPFFDSQWMFCVERFDAVVGNPPYGAKTSEKDKAYYKETYPACRTAGGVKGSTDTFAVFINRGLDLLAKGGVLSFIVPMSVTSSDAMCALHKMLFETCEWMRVASFSNRPKQIFESASLRTAIFMCKKTLTPMKELYTTRLIRRRVTDSMKNVIDRIKYQNTYKLKLRGRFAKADSKTSVGILTKVFATGSKLEDYKDDKGKPFYYRAAGGGYFNLIAIKPTGSTQDKELRVRYNEVIAAILSSSLFWFYQQVYADGLHLKQYEIDNFPLPRLECLCDGKIKEVEALYKEYLADIEKNAIVHSSSGASSYKVATFKEYKIRKSKGIIDRIDSLICPLYGLTAEETAFIKGYEAEFRMEEEK